MQLWTTRGYVLSEVISAMQKAVRRGDAKMAVYWAIEAWTKYGDYVWRRVLTISAEDCWGIITAEIKALHDSYLLVNREGRQRPGTKKGRIFLAKAILVMSQAPKSRDADHATNLIYDHKVGVSDEEIEKALEEALTMPEGELPAIPEYAFDVHTKKGRGKGKDREAFFVDEHNALKPRQQGLFDHLLAEGVKKLRE